MIAMTEKKKRQIDESPWKCPECDGRVVTDHDRGERHCEDCGLVIDSDMVDQGIDYRVYTEEHENRHRIGPPRSNTLHDKGLSTVIDTSMRDGHGRPLTGDMRRSVRRYSQLQKKSTITSSQDRNLVFAFTLITKKASHMGFSDDVKNETAHIYQRAVLENVIRGRSIRSVVASSFYLASRICKQDRTLDEIASGMGVSRKEVGRTAMFLKQKFKLVLPPPVPEAFVERYCQKAGLGNDIVSEARRLLGIVADAELLSGKSPMGWVAASIFTAVERVSDIEEAGITQKSTAKLCGVTEVTLRNRCNDLRELLRKRE